jgi:methyl-accepting chemotaxis protein
MHRFMARLFMPGAWLLNRMPTAGKFGLLGALICLPLAWLAWSEVHAQIKSNELLDLHRAQVAGLPALLRAEQAILKGLVLDEAGQRDALAALEQFEQAWSPARSIAPVGEAVSGLKKAIQADQGGPIEGRTEALLSLVYAMNAADMEAHGSSVPDPFSAVMLVAYPELVRAARLHQLGVRQQDYPLAMQMYQHQARLVKESRARQVFEMPAGTTPEQLLDGMPKRQAGMVASLQSEIDDMVAANRIRLWTHALALGALLIAVLYMAGALQHTTMRRMATLQRMVAAMEQADFSNRLRVDGHDEVADMLSSMNGSFDRLSELIRVVQDGASAVQFATEQLASGNTDLSDRNRRTIGGLQDVVASVARYATQLQACGSEVERMAETVQKLRMDSANSRKQMSRLQERMDALRNHSQDISQIVSLIDAIAFRTNVLALNASIEASKAGEAGRGFAVVAQEVRSLAMRSADSSRKIADIVRRSTEDIDLGAAMAEEAGRVIMGSEGHIDDVHQAITGVAKLTREGEDESKVILSEIRTLSDVTERNTDLVNQLANASRALQTQGSTLTDKVNQFQLG